MGCKLFRQTVNLFRLRKGEGRVALIVLLLFGLLNALNVIAYWNKLTPLGGDPWRKFIRGWHISGFDPITYSVLTDWSSGYNVYRHPLLAYFVWPFTMLNKGLMALFGFNWATIITACLLVFFATYTFIFLSRIFWEIIGTKKSEAYVLTSLTFSFAFIMLSMMVPDHFGPSMFCLVLTLYLCGRKLQRGKALNWWQTILMFFFTAGISLNNGLKIFLAALFTRRKKFFKPGYLIVAVLLPSLLMWYGARLSYRQFVWPKEHARMEKVMKKRKAMGQADKPIKKVVPKNTGKPLMQGEFMRWTDITTSRTEVAIEGLLGESIMLHEDYLLGDVLRNRPIIVHYKNWFNYIIEGILILLFLGGIICLIKNPLPKQGGMGWVSLSFFLMDMALHMGLGFGINEIYIMSPHYLYVLPILIAYLLVALSKKWRKRLTFTLCAITAYLCIWNVSLLVEYLYF